MLRPSFVALSPTPTPTTRHALWESDVDDTAQGSAILTMSALSMIGSFLIVFSYVAMKDMRTTSRLMLVWLSLCDFVTASGNSLGLLMDPVLPDWFCIVQSTFTTTSSICSFLWTASIGVYLYLSLGRREVNFTHVADTENAPISAHNSPYPTQRDNPQINPHHPPPSARNKHPHRARTMSTNSLRPPIPPPDAASGYRENTQLIIQGVAQSMSMSAVRRAFLHPTLWPYHLICWGVPAIVITIALSFGALGHNDYSMGIGWCWIAQDVDQTLWGLFAGKGWEILSYVVTAIFYAMTKYKLHALIASQESALLYSKCRKVVSQADNKLVLVPVIFVLVRIWGTVRFFLTLAKVRGSFWMSFIQGMGDSSQGFANCILFCLLTKKVRRRFYDMCCCCFNTAEQRRRYEGSRYQGTGEGESSSQFDATTNTNYTPTSINSPNAGSAYS